MPSWKYLQLSTYANTSTGKPNYWGIWGFYCVCAIVLAWLGDIAFLASPVVSLQMWTGNLIVLPFNITHAELFKGKATFSRETHTRSFLSCVGCKGWPFSLRLWSYVSSSYLLLVMDMYYLGYRAVAWPDIVWTRPCIDPFLLNSYTF